MSPKFLLNSAHNHGRQCPQRHRNNYTSGWDDCKIGNLYRVKPSSTLIQHETVIMGKSFYSLLPYLCSGYPRLASQELAFYHAYDGGWRNRCGIPWPLPACHAMPFTCQSFIVYMDWGIITVPLLCHGDLIKQQKFWPNTAFPKACKWGCL